eukprot:9485449-Pyramimonas_sp.AAC.2
MERYGLTPRTYQSQGERGGAGESSKGGVSSHTTVMFHSSQVPSPWRRERGAGGPSPLRRTPA